MASVPIVPNKRAKSQMWRYFGFPGDSSEAKVVICRLCLDNKFSYVGNTMNLVTHLDWHQKTEYSDYLKASGKSTSEFNISMYRDWYRRSNRCSTEGNRCSSSTSCYIFNAFNLLYVTFLAAGACSS